MSTRQLTITAGIYAMLCLLSISGFGQRVDNVPEAFEALGSKPEIIHLTNKIDIPNESGHFQGVQVIGKAGKEKLIISGSSLTEAYLLQVDLASRKTEKLIPLMKEPYRHAGGIQVSAPYLIVGIEDNFAKTASKVCLYDYRDGNLHSANPKLTINRKGEAKRKTAGATGLLAMGGDYLAVVSNWDSRNWDFYRIDPLKEEQKLLKSFTAPDDWASYQSINLVADGEAIYAIGFYSKETVSYADLILVSKLAAIEPILQQVNTKTFNCKDGVDFGAAAGLQVDGEGNLHIWGAQRNGHEQITVNKFSKL